MDAKRPDGAQPLHVAAAGNAAGVATLLPALAQLFFHELSHKNNAIYNILPEVISQLADPAAGAA